MHTASLKTEEVTMITRRIVACACALALAVPAAASARAGFDPPIKTTSHTVYGDTKYDLQNQQDLGSPAFKGDTKGDTKDDVAVPTGYGRVVVPAGKSAGGIAKLNDKQLAAAFGTDHPKVTPIVASTDDGTDGWQIAAVAEAGLLAALALGAATFVGRMRPRRSAAA
jgi:hypothetical protein